MEYEIEELLPIVAKLTDQYTSKESSSVPYETARSLMEAVVYCIEECFQGRDESIMKKRDKTDAGLLYERGCEIVVEKAFEAKKRYESLIGDFEDYHCNNYRDTILKGIPEFFMKYDAKFNPQDHILTLDYPLIMGNPSLCGVDLILDYLKGIQWEKRFLDWFDKRAVVGLLEKILPDYTSLYLDNIAYPVLINAIGCVIAEKPIERLELNIGDYGEVKRYFMEGDNLDDFIKMEQKIKGLIKLLVGRVFREDAARYFERMASDVAVRIGNGIREDSLERVIV